MTSEYDSDDSSAPSASPPISPTPSIHALPSVERLVQHYASAKRALNSTTHIWRANELVTSSRTLVEEIVTLNARCTYARRAVDEQIQSLHALKRLISVAGDDAGEEFRRTIEALDRANDRLERTVQALKNTVVDASLQAPSQDGEGDVESTDGQTESEARLNDEKTLFDFIDESSHSDLQTSLRALIDSFYDSRADLDESMDKLEATLNTISDVSSRDEKRQDSPDIGTIYDEPPLSISHLFRSMEDHAAEMATLLESLIKHYDLSVTALKHTEGGGEAARKAIQQADALLIHHGANAVEESLYLKTVSEPISDEERGDMLRVLENDAQEVEDVAGEIKDRNRDQESLYDQLTKHAQAARTADSNARHVLEMLHEMNDVHLPSHMHALATFNASWKRIRASLDSQTAELVSLSSFYDGFLAAYAKLLQEVDRRREAEKQARKVAEKASRELHRLFESDRGLREEFMEETGKFLPHGIWDGLTAGGVRWELREMASD